MSAAKMEKNNETTQLGELLLAKMEEQGKSIREVSAKVDITYEHMRRLVRGETLPSKWVLRQICEELGLDYAETERVAVGDKIVRRYGEIPDTTGSRKPAGNPEVAPIERVWGTLTPDQRETLLDMAKTMAKRNKVVKQ